MSIALGNSLSKGGMTGPTIVTDGLVLKHQYDTGVVVPVSDGAAYFDGSDDYIAITETTDSVDNANFSYLFWAKRNNASSSTDCVLGHTASGEKHIRFNNSGQLKMETDTAGDIAIGNIHSYDAN